MTKPQNISIEDFNYDLPVERIARYPLDKRDQSKMLLYSKGEISSRIFKDLETILKESDQLYFNTTRVIQARLNFSKSTGARIEVFCLEPESPSDYQVSFGSSAPVTWKCLVGNAKKWKHDKLSMVLDINGTSVIFNAEKVGMTGDKYMIRFSWDKEQFTFAELIENAGKTPIPPYLGRESEVSDAQNYQTVYAQYNGSVAAPTAGLHFTDDLLFNLKSKGVGLNNLTLHVGAGTFIPVKEENAAMHRMHSELVTVDSRLLKSLLNEGQKRIAVGTTSVRSLESLYWLGVKSITQNPFNFDQLVLKQWEAYEMRQDYSLKEAILSLLSTMEKNSLDSFSFLTQIMIAPGYRFRTIDGLITNFHQPKSTLLLLISSLVGEDWRNIYNFALDNDYRFLSYGDSSLLLR